jgi:hypothetical protein
MRSIYKDQAVPQFALSGVVTGIYVPVYWWIAMADFLSFL